MTELGRDDNASPLQLNVSNNSDSYCDLRELHASESYARYRKLADTIYARRRRRNRLRSLFKSTILS
jgi:hypothetical protein